MHKGALCLHVLLLVGASVGCASTTPQPQTEQSASEEGEQKSDLQMQSELGVLDQDAVRSTFESLWKGPLEACRAKGGEFISGNIAVKLRIHKSGKVEWAHFTQTTLGDRDVEKCMLDAVKNASWPTPEGGDAGIAEQELPFADKAERPPVEWDTDNIRETLVKAQSKIASCAEGGVTFSVTAIVNTTGKPASVGIATPNEKSEQAADCMVDVVKSLKFPTPGSWPAKVTFELP